MTSNRFILHPSEARAEDNLGGKGRALARLTDLGLPVPEWLAVLPSAFEPGSPRLRPEAAAELAGWLAKPDWNTEVFAVRSSASDEDGAGHSFAGQLESFLFVSPEHVLARVGDVWHSAFSERAATYRRERGLAESGQAPAVIVQRMVRAEAAGVAFSADPVSGRRGLAVVSAVPGLGSALVDGEAEADTFHVDREGRIQLRQIVAKSIRHAMAEGGGVKSVQLADAESKGPAISDKTALEVARLARTCGRVFGRPQDIEWAFADGRVHLLQSRPITSLAGQVDPDGRPDLWDNSNISESYNGVTSPMTFSFARHVYEEVYRQFCLILSVPAKRVADSQAVFARMLGCIEGRVYYNLPNWYRTLRLLPGFTMNRAFMEQMMGVKEGLPARFSAEFDTAPAGLGARVGDGLALVRTVAGLVWQGWRLPAMRERFHRRLDDVLRPTAVPLDAMRPDELAAHYRDLERELLSRWDAPLVNDFLAMIFHGTLRKLCRNWCNDEGDGLANGLIAGMGGIISAEPAKRLESLAGQLRNDAEAIQILGEGSPAQILACLRVRPGLEAEFAAYLERFGDRCLEELKLETETLGDDPTLLHRTVARMAATPAKARTAEDPSAALLAEAEAKVDRALAGHGVRRVVFDWVLRLARERVRDRENLRFERTRVFGRVRRIIVELGKRLHAEGRLEAPRDVFLLTLDELLGFVEGTAVTTRLKELAALRREEWAAYRAASPPADRFETTGWVAVGQNFRPEPPKSSPSSADSAEERQGQGCCPGIVRAKVRVILDPRGAEIRPGEILVAPRTDPGWIMLFPPAAGLLVERGSLLSHSAIVARELRLPAVVAVPGLTAWLRTGDEVEFDGASGVIRRLVRSEGGAA